MRFKKVLKGYEKQNSIKLDVWIKQNTTNAKKVKKIKIYNQTRHEYKNANSIYAEVHENLKGKNYILPEYYLNILEGGKCYSEDGYILTPDDIFIDDFTVISPHPLRNFKKMPRGKRYKCKVVVLAVNPADSNYYHWMIESIPRLKLLDKANLKAEKYYVSYHLPFQKEALDLLGITESQLIDPKDKKYIMAEEMIVPDIINNFDTFISKGHYFYKAKFIPHWAVEFLRKSFLNKAKETKIRRIYISRKNALHRKILNENEVYNMLRRFGFYKIELDNIKLVDQVSLFSNADFIISPHGAGLTNLVFCNANTKVLELFSKDYVNNFFWLISNILKLNYNYLLSEKDLCDNVNPQYENIEVNLKLLKKSIFEMI